MTTGKLIRSDIYFYISKEDRLRLGNLRVENSRLVKEELEILLECDETSNFKARICIDYSVNNPDGIDVTRIENRFLIKINDKAYWRMRDNKLSGTRYNDEDKIHFIHEEA